MAAEMRKQLEALMGAEALGTLALTLLLNCFSRSRVTEPDFCEKRGASNQRARLRQLPLWPVSPHLVHKMDLGACDKLHSDRLKGEYEEALRHEPRNSLEHDFIRNLEAFVADCDRKILQAQRRLDKTPGDDTRTMRLMEEIRKLDTEIAGKMQEVEILGEEGKVTESIEALKEADRLKADKTAKEKEIQSAGEAPSQQQKLRVCEVCSAYLSVFDSDRRLADHFGGKMHMGYVKIRDLLKELKEKRAGNGMGVGPGAPPGGGVEFRERGGYGGDRGSGYNRDRDRSERGGSSGGGGSRGGLIRSSIVFVSQLATAIGTTDTTVEIPTVIEIVIGGVRTGRGVDRDLQEGAFGIENTSEEHIAHVKGSVVSCKI
ncbi:LUC7-domain-containing protein [Jimgerdemannia flammicorona]|uniref:LUC7-domain-containing protein n=1 Tax=Jimgerdemannia flammicorona TaxID=994334 RepID=A0A433D2D6_9FUNG|nr:LUC7-domain-containing protein [Jimgerdemannia flammicorona]